MKSFNYTQTNKNLEVLQPLLKHKKKGIIALFLPYRRRASELGVLLLYQGQLFLTNKISFINACKAAKLNYF